MKDLEDKLDAVVRALIPTQEFNDALKTETEILQKYMEKGDEKGITPKVIIKGMKNGQPFSIAAIIMIEGGDQAFKDNKHTALRELGKKIALDTKHFAPTMVFMHAEAWVRQFSKEEGEDIKKNGMEKEVSEYNDKQEIALVTGMTIDFRFNMSMTQIIRTKDNNIILGANSNYNYYDEKLKKQSAVSNLLPEFFRGYLDGINLRQSTASTEVSKEPEKEEKLVN